MAILIVTVSGKEHLIETDNKATAKSYGRSLLEETIEVREATGPDLVRLVVPGEPIKFVESAAEKKRAAEAAKLAEAASGQPEGGGGGEESGHGAE